MDVPPSRIVTPARIVALTVVASPARSTTGMARLWSIRTKIIGLAAAVGGPLLGGWLGFHSTERFVALIITMVGAVILAFDVTPASQWISRAVEGNRSVRPVLQA